ncbi:nuclease-related domain-containing protein [Arthrobacter zhaoxinii]|uniref:nuclease-related domain-containing protein n=1 Tax=Arthrobacter zhaoxinii TaxID=2964616 RepID=UPI0021067532|nr:nuclease-related domain-containing protein [Arthrobacter zhaoxinii]MCQ2001135.1 NERD domain-containing protein [Arthrobacter zhaoxinii]
MTGFEPAKLRSYHAPVSLRAHGLAGLGLFDSGFDSSNIYNGQRGEVGFYKALCLEDLIDDCSSYWSVAMPGDDGVARPDSKFQTDVDCIVVQGKTMYLIDLKYYASGDVTWHTRDGQWLLCRDNATGEQVGKPRHMSRNMAMAQDRFQRIFPGLQIKSYVVLIPTQDGLGNIASGTAWPGEVELINLPRMLAIIRAGGAGFAEDSTQQKLLALLKD